MPRLRRGDNLDRLPLDDGEGRAECFVAPQNLFPAALEYAGVQRSADPHAGRAVVYRQAGCQLLDEPEPVLRKGERRRPAALPARDGGNMRRAPLRQFCLKQRAFGR